MLGFCSTLWLCTKNCHNTALDWKWVRTLFSLTFYLYAYLYPFLTLTLYKFRINVWFDVNDFDIHHIHMNTHTHSHTYTQAHVGSHAHTLSHTRFPFFSFGTDCRSPLIFHPSISFSFSFSFGCLLMVLFITLREKKIVEIIVQTPKDVPRIELRIVKIFRWKWILSFSIVTNSNFCIYLVLFVNL